MPLYLCQRSSHNALAPVTNPNHPFYLVVGLQKSLSKAKYVPDVRTLLD